MEMENLAVKLGMQQKVFRSTDGALLNYCVRKTGGCSGNDAPAVLLFLHGAGERGNDNQLQLKHCAADLVNFCEREKIKAVLLFPQCPQNVMWIEQSWSLTEHEMTPEPTPQLRHALELLDSVIGQEKCDAERVYISGISMGGFGTWEALSRRPEFFAAAIPVCGGGDVRQAPKLKDIPIRVFHGSEDSVVNVKRSRDMVAAIRAAGGTKISYTEYPGVNHNSWSATYADHDNLRWLFSQSR